MSFFCNTPNAIVNAVRTAVIRKELTAGTNSKHACPANSINAIRLAPLRQLGEPWSTPQHKEKPSPPDLDDKRKKKDHSAHQKRGKGVAKGTQDAPKYCQNLQKTKKNTNFGEMLKLYQKHIIYHTKPQ